jgi:hypothetical protein
MTNSKETPIFLEQSPLLRRFEKRDEEAVYKLHLEAMPSDELEKIGAATY